jgi:hypothetical protein
MSGRSDKPRPRRGEEDARRGGPEARHKVGPPHRRALSPERDWISAHRAARIQARAEAARARHLRHLEGRGRRGY